MCITQYQWRIKDLSRPRNISRLDKLFDDNIRLGENADDSSNNIEGALFV